MLSIKEIGVLVTLAIPTITFAVWLGKLDGRMTATESHLEKMEQTIFEEKRRALNEIRLAEEEATKKIKIIHCTSAKLVSPKGALEKDRAIEHSINKSSTISWQPAECQMTIQYYQNGKMIKEYKNISPGEKIRMEGLTNGQTEIRIKKDEVTEPSDSIWVFILELPDEIKPPSSV